MSTEQENIISEIERSIDQWRAAALHSKEAEIIREELVIALEKAKEQQKQIEELEDRYVAITTRRGGKMNAAIETLILAAKKLRNTIESAQTQNFYAEEKEKADLLAIERAIKLLEEAEEKKRQNKSAMKSGNA